MRSNALPVERNVIPTGYTYCQQSTRSYNKVNDFMASELSECGTTVFYELSPIYMSLYFAFTPGIEIE